MTFRSKLLPAKIIAIVLSTLLGLTAVGAQTSPALMAGQADLVFVEGGSYKIGEWRFGFDHEGAHDVKVSSFYISAHEITVADYAEFDADFDDLGILERLLLEFGLKPKPGQVWNGKEFESKADAAWDHPYLEQDESHPVVLVTWNDAA